MTVQDLIAAWGNWTLFVGVLVSLGIEAWRRVKPDVFDRLSSVARRIIPMLVAGLSAGAAVAIAGADWAGIGVAALSAWGTALMTGDTLRWLLDLLLPKGGVDVADLVADLDEPANAKQKGQPPVGEP